MDAADDKTLSNTSLKRYSCPTWRSVSNKTRQRGRGEPARKTSRSHSSRFRLRHPKYRTGINLTSSPIEDEDRKESCPTLHKRESSSSRRIPEHGEKKSFSRNRSADISAVESSLADRSRSRLLVRPEVHDPQITLTSLPRSYATGLHSNGIPKQSLKLTVA